MNFSKDQYILYRHKYKRKMVLNILKVQQNLKIIEVNNDKIDDIYQKVLRNKFEFCVL